MSFKLGFLAITFPFLLAVAGRSAMADEVYTFVVKKQEEKAKSRWNLADWITTRDHMRMMDLWLALHSPTSYEFFFGGHYQVGDLAPGGAYGGYGFSAAAYATIFGLELEREAGLDTRYTGLFHLRIFGFNYQSTHIRLEAGVRQEDNGSGGVSFRNALAGVGMNLYLGKHFGLEGLFRHAFDSTANATGMVFSGNRYEGGAFIDFSFVRIYGKYLYEKLSPELSNLAIDAVRSGPMLGMKVFF